MKIGYESVPTDEQNLNLQLDALKGAGCKKIFKDEGYPGLLQFDWPLLKSNRIKFLLA
jgi:hypothetical protein